MPQCLVDQIEREKCRGINKRVKEVVRKQIENPELRMVNQEIGEKSKSLNFNLKSNLWLMSDCRSNKNFGG